MRIMQCHLYLNPCVNNSYLLSCVFLANSSPQLHQSQHIRTHVFLAQELLQKAALVVGLFEKSDSTPIAQLCCDATKVPCHYGHIHLSHILKSVRHSCGQLVWYQ